MNWKVLVGGLIVALPMVWVLASGFGRDPHALPSAMEGKPAPDFRLLDLDGREHALSELAGRPVVLNFWSTWCGPCKIEHPLLVEAGRRWGDEVAFLGILYGDEPEKARAYLRRMGASYPTLVDEGGRVAIDYGVAGVPETFFIDRTGRIRHKVTGPLDGRTLTAALESIR